MATTILKTGTKLAIGGGAVYVTLNQGVWSNSSQARATAFNKFKTTIDPNDYLHQMPTTSDVNEKVKDTWNSGVQAVFNGIATSPETVSTYTKKAVHEVQKNIKS